MSYLQFWIVYWLKRIIRIVGITPSISAGSNNDIVERIFGYHKKIFVRISLLYIFDVETKGTHCKECLGLSYRIADCVIRFYDSLTLRDILTKMIK